MLRLHGLLNLIERWGRLPALLERLRRGETAAVALPEGAKPYLLAVLQQQLATPILVVTARPGRARELLQQISAWSANPERVLLFPEPDSLPHERMPQDPTATAARLAAMFELAGASGPNPLPFRPETGHAPKAGGSDGRGQGPALRLPLPERENRGEVPGGRGQAPALRHRGDEGPSTQHSAPSTQQPLGPQSSVLSPIVVASARAMMELLMSPRELGRSIDRLRTGQRIQLQATLSRWMELGYEAAAVVESPGSFSRRGGILDIYPPGSPNPFRIELFGDEIESIRAFDPITQRSAEPVDEVVVTPTRASGLAGRGDGDGGTRGRGDAETGGRGDGETQGRGDSENPEPRTQNPEPISAPRASHSLLDYLPPGGLLVLDDPAQIAAVSHDLFEQAVHLQLQAAERGETASGSPPALRQWDSSLAAIRSGRWALLEMRYDPEAEELPFTAPPSYGGKVKLVLEEAVRFASGLRTEDSGLSTQDSTRSSVLSPQSSPVGRVVLVSQQSQRLAELLAEQDHAIAPTQAIDGEPQLGLHLVHGSLSHGWSSDLLGTLVLGDSEIFGWTKAHRVVRRRAAPRDAFLSDLVEGDLAVHVEHGIGRFRGLRPMQMEGREREYLVLEYAEGDRLYVPVDQVDRVGRYVGAGDESPSLSRLGTSEWTRAKERVKSSVRDVARELLQIYSTREAQLGHAFSPDTPWQGDLEASFPYVETPDQLRVVHEVKADMELARPMDRLICGDVGYGKTEVALRAAFKAVMDGKQVAVLVPTTVLAQQHHNSFRERLQPFPVNVEVLSRFRSEREQRRVLEGLRTGAVDIVIGTHRLIQKDVQFRDLGLVIVDEEQRFGVMHKERLKQLRQQVDVLTLSATPIPRTLHMSLAGIRDMSTMETAPEDRLPIRTFVAEYSDSLVREAVLREMDRGGQVYFVHNRVQSIQFVAGRLQELVPEARIAVGHGQMPEEALERVMVEFADGQYDVLVCTTIIESGLDIPNVNTIVVNQADRFGLAQLYQLRGRVGRGANRAYAYFLYSRDRTLSETAEKRLKTIFENTELGSGFRIAMKDLEIRGAGNLLGVEQHGQVNAVGFDLYTRLLAQAIGELQGKAAPTAPEVSIDLPLPAQLPPDYVADEAARLSLYQRLAVIKREEELGEMMEEIRDRFGPLPVEAQNLLYLVDLKLLAGRIGISSISTMEDEIVIKLDGIPLTVRGQLQRQHGSRLRVLPNQIRLKRGSGDQWMAPLQGILDQLQEAARLVAVAR